MNDKWDWLRTVVDLSAIALLLYLLGLIWGLW
jgi:hypothetical protein